ncbi:MAG: ABC transporter ATP-binding protein [Candidatus Bathyarchaeia archaeon]|jgi:simple sugar transport system ATP-binding protein
MTNPNTTPENALVAEGITKRFGSLAANDNVNFTVKRGEVHALLGENGAGKTTLCNMLYGLLRPDSGRILVDGKETRFHSPRDAMNAKIAMVHQEFMLLNPMTVVENVAVMQNEGWRHPLIKRESLESEIAEVAKRNGLAVDPNATIRELSAGQRQSVEIVKALFKGANILILDEPTSVLSPLETRELFSALRQMAKAGKSIVFVSHKIDEILAVTDNVTVLKQGKVVATESTKKVTGPELAKMIVGREVLFRTQKLSAQITSPFLELNDIDAVNNLGLNALEQVSISVKGGEILGIAGIAGNGQRELVEVATGIRKPTAGKISVMGKDVTGWVPDEIRELGLAHIPEDQKAGLVFDFSLSDNLMIEPHVARMFTKAGLLDRRSIGAELTKLMSEYDVRAQSQAVPIWTLSGGNKQKFLLSRELFWNPKVIIAHNPTKGLDVAATEYTRKILMREKEKGRAILLISTELDELLDMSDRIAVMCNGRISGTFPINAVKIEEIAILMTQSKSHSS